MSAIPPSRLAASRSMRDVLESTPPGADPSRAALGPDPDAVFLVHTLDGRTLRRPATSSVPRV